MIPHLMHLCGCFSCCSATGVCAGVSLPSLSSASNCEPEEVDGTNAGETDGTGILIKHSIRRNAASVSHPSCLNICKNAAEPSRPNLMASSVSSAPGVAGNGLHSFCRHRGAPSRSSWGIWPSSISSAPGVADNGVDDEEVNSAVVLRSSHMSGPALS